MLGSLQIPLLFVVQISLEGGSIPSVSGVCWSSAGVVLTPHIVASETNVSWSLPGQQSIDIYNVDDSFFSSTLASEIGGVFKDHFGLFLSILELQDLALLIFA